jgi:hypothetical protein
LDRQIVINRQSQNNLKIQKQVLLMNSWRDNYRDGITFLRKEQMK